MAAAITGRAIRGITMADITTVPRSTSDFTEMITVAITTTTIIMTAVITDHPWLIMAATTGAAVIPLPARAVLRVTPAGAEALPYRRARAMPVAGGAGNQLGLALPR